MIKSLTNYKVYIKMEEASAPKPLIEYKTKVELDNNILNISLIQKSNILIIQANQLNSIPPFLYEGEYTKKDLDSVSRYFRISYKIKYKKYP